MERGLTTAVVLAALVLAACGSDDDGDRGADGGRDEVGQRVTPKSVLDIDELGYSYAELPKAGPQADKVQKAVATAGLTGPPSLGFTCSLPT